MKTRCERKLNLFYDSKEIKVITTKNKYILSLFPSFYVDLNEFNEGITFIKVRRNSEYFHGEIVFEYCRILGVRSALALQY